MTAYGAYEEVTRPECVYKCRIIKTDCVKPTKPHSHHTPEITTLIQIIIRVGVAFNCQGSKRARALLRALHFQSYWIFPFCKSVLVSARPEKVLDRLNFEETLVAINRVETHHIFKRGIYSRQNPYVKPMQIGHLHPSELVIVIINNLYSLIILFYLSNQ